MLGVSSVHISSYHIRQAFRFRTNLLCKPTTHCRSVAGTPDRLRRQEPTTPHECLARMDSGHHVHRTALTIHAPYSTRTADTPLPLSHSPSLTLWHLTLAPILVQPFTSCSCTPPKCYSALEVHHAERGSQCTPSPPEH